MRRAAERINADRPPAATVVVRTEDFDGVRGVILARDHEGLLEGRLQSHLVERSGEYVR